MKRRMYVLLAASLAAVVVLSAAGCSKKVESAAKPFSITVSILPQKYFAERIAGGRASVTVLAGPGQSPHSYEPTPAQMAGLASSSFWVLSGTDFERPIIEKAKSQFPSLTVVNGTDGVTFRQLQEYEQELDAYGHEEGEEHAEADSRHEDEISEGEDHGEAEGKHEGEISEEEDHHHDTNVDLHTWLGSEPALIMAGHIKNALISADPAGKEVYTANYDALCADIGSVFDTLKAQLAPLAGKSVLVFHPSFGYFFDEFGLRQSSVETGGKEPSAKALAALIEKAQMEKPPAVFVQAQFPVEAARTVAAAAGAQVIPLDPLAPDWLDNIKRMGAALGEAYSTK